MNYLENFFRPAPPPFPPPLFPRQTAASSSPDQELRPASPPPDPELRPGWEVYKNKQGEPLYGNKKLQICQFHAPLAQVHAPLAQVHEQHIPVHMPYGYVPGSSQDPFAGRGGLKRKQSKRKRMQTKRKQTKRKQTKRRS